MNYELNQMVGLEERDQSKFLGMLVQQHVHNALDSNPKSNHWIGRIF